MLAAASDLGPNQQNLADPNRKEYYSVARTPLISVLYNRYGTQRMRVGKAAQEVVFPRKTGGPGRKYSRPSIPYSPSAGEEVEASRRIGLFSTSTNQ